MNDSVTFIMPAYNVEDYIEEAVKSIQNQTIPCWELIIVNDGSTDATLEIAQRLASTDTRIKVLQMEAPSGSAYQPRKKGIIKAASKWVAPLDADDWIEPNYLEKLIEKQRETEADIVYPSMWDPVKNEVITPRNQSLFEKKMAGRDCVIYTLDGWRINCNGGIIRKSLYQKAFDSFDSSLVYSCADELLTRQLLSITPKVAFSVAKYFYRHNEESITRKKSVKLFDFLQNNYTLLSFVKDIYGETSEEYLLAHRQNFHGFFDAAKLLSRFDFSKKDRQVALALMCRSRKASDLKLLKGRVSPRYRLLLHMPMPAINLAVRLLT